MGAGAARMADADKKKGVERERKREFSVDKENNHNK